MNDNIRKKPILSLEELLKKEYKFVFLKDALRDVIPPNWSNDVLSGKRKIVVGTKDEVL